MTPFDPAFSGWTTSVEDGFIGLVGPIWSRGEGAARRFGFLGEPRHANLVGVVQGGMLMTFADRALGILALAAAERPCVTIAFDMNFADAGRIGSFLECSGEVLRRTRDLVFMRGTITCGSRIVASCQGTWKILGGRRSGVPAG